MTDAQAQAESLLNEAMPLAKKLLCKSGEFFPFAAATGPYGGVVFIQGYDGRERPPSLDLIDLLAAGLREGARAGDYISTVLVYDVRVTPPHHTLAIDAVAAELEHRDGYAATVFLPYTLTDGEIAFAPTFATAESRNIFIT